MRSLLALPLAACATAPAQLETIKHEVDGRASYAYYTGWDKRVLNAGDSGNCAAFAHSYQDEGLKSGVPLGVTSCTLKDGQQHAFAISYDRQWALDIRHRSVVRFEDVGCK